MKPNPGMAILALAYAMSINLAQAQVNRCHDSSGRVVYSDRPCESSQSGGQIERRKTRDEIHRERLQAQEAEEQKQERYFAEQQREAERQNQRALQSQPAPTVRHSGNDWAARKALENASTSASSITNNGGKWDAAAQAERARARQEENRKRWAEEEQRAQAEAAARPRPTAITSCVSYTCYDNAGGSYNRATGDKNLMIGPGGQKCRRIEPGQQWQCN